MKKVLSIYLRVCLVLLPIFYLPIVVDAFGLGKNLMIFGAMSIGLILWGISLLTDKESKIVMSKGWGWLVALSIWATIFWFLGETGVRARTLLGVPGLGMLWAVTIWMFLWAQVEEKRNGGELGWLTVAGLLTAVTSLIVFLIPVSKLPWSWPEKNPLITLAQGWSLVGSVWGEIWLLMILGIMWLVKLLAKVKTRSGYIKELIITAVLVLVLFLDVFKMVKNGWGYLGVKEGWAIATESLKNKPLQGVGVGNFLEAFYWWRPASFNSSKNWTGTYSWSTNGGLQLWTEMGLVGLVLGILVLLAIAKGQKENKRKKITLLLGLILALTPIDLVAYFLVMWLVTKDLKSKEVRLVLRGGESGFNLAPIIVAVLAFLISGLGLYNGTRIFLGDFNLRKSVLAAARNDGSQTYNWQIKAITANPNNAEYRRIYSQTNLALATSILSNKEMTDDQKEKASVLIQQAVREGKAAVALDTKNPLYWSNLASIYRQLVGSVDGAADWSYQAYNEAVALDPVNPSLRLEFGGLMFAAGGYDEADRLFEQVVSLKSDLANGWYNWAYTAKKKNNLAAAINRLNQALTLVPADSGDYDTASKELEAWKKEYDALVKKQSEAASQQKQAETLKLPEALPSGTNTSVDVSGEGLEPPAVPTVSQEQKSGNQVIEP